MGETTGDGGHDTHSVEHQPSPPITSPKPLRPRHRRARVTLGGKLPAGMKQVTLEKDVADAKAVADKAAKWQFFLTTIRETIQKCKMPGNTLAFASDPHRKWITKHLENSDTLDTLFEEIEKKKVGCAEWEEWIRNKINKLKTKLFKKELFTHSTPDFYKKYDEIIKDE